MDLLHMSECHIKKSLLLFYCWLDVRAIKQCHIKWRCSAHEIFDVLRYIRKCTYDDLCDLCFYSIFERIINYGRRAHSVFGHTHSAVSAVSGSDGESRISNENDKYFSKTEDPWIILWRINLFCVMCIHRLILFFGEYIFSCYLTFDDNKYPRQKSINNEIECARET